LSVLNRHYPATGFVDFFVNEISNSAVKKTAIDSNVLRANTRVPWVLTAIEVRRDSDIGGFPFWLGQVNSASLRDTSPAKKFPCAAKQSIFPVDHT
jgi:hypothetical protein